MTKENYNPYFLNKYGNLVLTEEQLKNPLAFKEVPNIRLVLAAESPSYLIDQSLYCRVLEWDDENKPYFKSIITSYIKACIKEKENKDLIWTRTNNSYYLVCINNYSFSSINMGIIASTSVPKINTPVKVYLAERRLAKFTETIVTPTEITVESHSSSIYKMKTKEYPNVFIVIVKE